MSVTALSLRRKLLYAAIASLAGLLLLLGALELGLRAFNSGYSPHFARRTTDANGQPVWRENRWCTAPYFSPERVRRPQAFSLPVAKSARTYRVFVLGSSAAMGDPEASFSLARTLSTLLSAAYPDIHFEIVNAGITAINSHLVRSIAADCAALAPDLFIVYEGNNEVIGPYGPAAVLAPFRRSERAVRASVWAQGTRTGQVLAAASRRLGPSPGAGDWGGMQMFLAHEIAADDPRLDTVRQLFAANLRAVARTARQAGAPVLLCTVATNQRDFAPFASRHRAGLSAAELAKWQEQFNAGVSAESSGALGSAEEHYHAAAAIDDAFAELSFRRGRVALPAGRDSDARRFLQRALDLDVLRFRTDSTLNAVIPAVAASEPGATLVDLAAELARESAHGVVGDELVYEHVHLTFRGTYTMAVHLLPAIASDLEKRGLAKAAAATSPLPIEAVRQRLAFTTYEQAMIGLELLRRFRAPPFTAQTDNTARIAAWERRVAAANALLSRPEATAALGQVYEQAIAIAPEDWVLRRNAGAMLVARGQPAKAVPLLEQALRFIPDDADTLVALGLAQRALGHTDEAARTFNAARAIEPRHPLLPKP